MNRENETVSLAIDGLRGIAAKPIETPVVKRTPWSFTGGDDDSDAQSMATTVSDDCSKSAYLRLCDDVECALEDLIVGVDDLSAWKNNIISLIDLPKNVLTRLMVAVSRLCRVKSTMRLLLSDVGLIHLSRVLANGVLRDSEIRRLKNLAVQCRSQLDLEEMRTMEAERKLRASLAQTLSLRSQNRVFRWYILQNKLMAREKKKLHTRKMKTLRDHTVLLKKMLSHANVKIRKLTNQRLESADGDDGDAGAGGGGGGSRTRKRARGKRGSTTSTSSADDDFADDEHDIFKLDHKEQYEFEEIMDMKDRVSEHIVKMKKKYRDQIGDLKKKFSQVNEKLMLVESERAAVDGGGGTGSSGRSVGSRSGGARPGSRPEQPETRSTIAARGGTRRRRRSTIGLRRSSLEDAEKAAAAVMAGVLSPVQDEAEGAGSGTGPSGLGSLHPTQPRSTTAEGRPRRPSGDKRPFTSTGAARHRGSRMEKRQLVREQSWREKRHSIAQEVAAREEIDWKLENGARAELEAATIAAANAVARRDEERDGASQWGAGRDERSVGIRASGFFPRARTLSGGAVSARSSGYSLRPGTSGGIGLGAGGMGSRSRTARPNTSSSGMRKKVKVALHSPAPFSTVDFIARAR